MIKPERVILNTIVIMGVLGASYGLGTHSQSDLEAAEDVGFQKAVEAYYRAKGNEAFLLTYDSLWYLFSPRHDTIYLKPDTLAAGVEP